MEVWSQLLRINTYFEVHRQRTTRLVEIKPLPSPLPIVNWVSQERLDPECLLVVQATQQLSTALWSGGPTALVNYV
jgi:hypothetical protein